MSDAELREIVSATPFDDTLERVTAAITQAGLTLLHRPDSAASNGPPGGRAGGRARLATATVLTYGHPKGGTPIMLSAPVAALDLPLRVLVRVREDGQTVLAFHPIAAMLRRAGVPDPLAGRLDPAQQILVDAVAR